MHIHRCRIAVLSLLSFLGGNAAGSQFTVSVDTSPNSYSYHWDQWIYRYSPEHSSGWGVPELYEGNDWDTGFWISAAAKDGSTGQSIEIRINFAVEVGSWYLSDEALSQVDGGGLDSLENFGAASGFVYSTVKAHNEDGSSTFAEKEIFAAFRHTQTKNLSVTIPYTTGSGDIFIATDIRDHVRFAPNSLTVHDAAKPALFGIETHFLVTASGAKVVSVPDDGDPVSLMGCVLAGMFYLARRRVRSRLTAARRALSRGLYLVCLLGIVTSGRAAPYTVNWGGNWGIGTENWDMWLYQYTPGVGWNSSSIGGDNYDETGTLEVLANDGSSGQTVDVKLSFRAGLFAVYLDNTGWPGAENYKGMASGQLREEFSVYIEGPNFGAGASRQLVSPLGFDGFREFSLTVPYVVGSVGDDPALVDLNLNSNPYFFPHGLKIDDDSKPATFLVEAGMVVWMTDAEVVGVPDGGALSVALIVTIAGLVLLSRRQRG